jgi:DNA-binding MarR family transcriptional regulator
MPNIAKSEQDHINSFIQNILRMRRSRERYLPPDLLCDPAWDMMLDLYLSDQRGREVGVSSLCLAAHAPTTTALRWIALLEKEELIVRRSAPRDRRLCLLSLTEKGSAAMEGWARQSMRR